MAYLLRHWSFVDAQPAQDAQEEHLCRLSLAADAARHRRVRCGCLRHHNPLLLLEEGVDAVAAHTD
jgi:hypothetical protein